MIELLGEAFSWNVKWFFGSATTAFGLPFIAQKIAKDLFKKDISVGWSFAIAGLVLLTAIIARFISLANEKLTQQEAKFVNWSFAIVGLIILSTLAVWSILFFNKKITQQKAEIEAYQKEIQEYKNKIEESLQRQPKNYNRSSEKNSAYGLAIVLLKDGFSHIHFLRKEKKFTGDRITPRMILMCNQLKKAFEHNTNKKYTVSIKLFRQSSTEVEVLYTDESSSEARQEYNENPILIKDNTCYDHIIKKIPDSQAFYFLSNNLVVDLSYRSSAFKISRMPSNVVTLADREAKWPLPYKSELVVPICPDKSKGQIFDRHKEVIGFLCVDCDQTDGFNKEYDPAMLQGVADGIYDLFPLWKSQQVRTKQP